MINIKEYAFRLIEDYFSEPTITSLKEIDYLWNNRFNGATAGVCRFKKINEELKPYKIEVSSKYIVEFPDMLDSILLHEMLHASLSYEEKHGAKFKEYASKLEEIALLNYNKVLKITTKIPVEKQVEKNYKYIYACKVCSVEYRRVRKPININKYVCGKCKGKLKQIK